MRKLVYKPQELDNTLPRQANQEFFETYRFKVRQLNIAIQATMNQVDSNHHYIIGKIHRLFRVISIKDHLESLQCKFRLSEDALNDLFLPYQNLYSPEVELSDILHVNQASQYIDCMHSYYLYQLNSSDFINSIHSFYTDQSINEGVYTSLYHAIYSFLEQGDSLSKWSHLISSQKSFQTALQRMYYYHGFANFNEGLWSNNIEETQIDKDNFPSCPLLLMTILELKESSDKDVLLRLHPQIYNLLVDLEDSIASNLDNFLEILWSSLDYFHHSSNFNSQDFTRTCLALFNIYYSPSTTGLDGQAASGPTAASQINKLYPELKYQNISLFELMVYITKDSEDVDSINFSIENYLQSKTTEVLNCIELNINHLPDLLKHDEFRSFFLSSTHRIDLRLNHFLLTSNVSTILQACTLDQINQMFTFALKTKDIQYISGIIGFIANQKSNPLLIEFLDAFLAIFDSSKRNNRKACRFLNKLNTELSNKSYSDPIHLFNFLIDSAQNISDIDQYIIAAEREFTRLNLHELYLVYDVSIFNSGLNTPSAIQDSVIKLLRSLFERNALEDIDVLSQAYQAYIEDRFDDYKFPKYIQKDFHSILLKTGGVCRWNGVTMVTLNNFESLLNMGMSPIPTCLDVEHTETASVLVSHIAEPNIFLWGFEMNNKLVARRVAVLAKDSGGPVLLAMPIYTNLKDENFFKRCEALTTYFAQSLSLPLIICSSDFGCHPKFINVFEKCTLHNFDISLDLRRVKEVKLDVLPVSSIAPKTPGGLYRLDTRVSGYYFKVK